MLKWFALLLVAFSLIACDDDASTTTPVVDDDAEVSREDAAPTTIDSTVNPEVDQGETPPPADTGVVDSAPIDPDIPIIDDADITPDVAVDAAMDAAVPDAEMDAAVPDATSDMAILDAGPECVEGDDTCGLGYACLDGNCRLDVRPSVFRMVRGTVTQPENGGPQLETALNLGVMMGELNLLFEPAGYDAETGKYLWHIGNGRNNGDAYSFRHDLPIQGFLGHWFEGLHWWTEPNVAFALNVPSGQVQVETEDGPQNRLCWTLFTTYVTLHFEPQFIDGGVRMIGSVTGYLRREDAELVSFSTGGSEVHLIDFLDGDELTIDSDGDGVNDSYTFDMTVEADAIIFDDDNAERNPESSRENPPECDQ